MEREVTREEVPPERLILFEEIESEDKPGWIILKSHLPSYLHPIEREIPEILERLNYKVGVKKTSFWGFQQHLGYRWGSWRSKELFIKYSEENFDIQLEISSSSGRRREARIIAKEIENAVITQTKKYIKKFGGSCYEKVMRQLPALQELLS